MVGAYIAGTGYHHPDRRVGNDEIASKIDSSDRWIRDHTGIVERRYAPDDVNTSDLGVLATRNALERAEWAPDEVDLFVCATSTPDCLIPPTASYICEKLNLRAVAFDLNAACSGFLYGLSVTQGMMESQGYERAALCAADKYSRVIDTSERNSVLWGDSAGTVLLQRERPEVGAEIVDLVLENFNHGADLVKIPLGGHFWMDGPAVKKIASKGFLESARHILERNDLEPNDLRAFMAHQANLRMLEALAEELGLDPERHWHNVESCGNQGAAGVATTWCAGTERFADKLNDGDLFVMTVYGSGFTGGSALLRWTDSHKAQAAASPAATAAGQ
ncbi:MAG: 3-oxoacyl-ACP synthase III family protein [Solirubrobacterales bacterium]